eukprot:TRINITY_DN113655_c0_g1_i1.p1 TRINITY_DN113655_c0_g1~~TRINITY_DN113655_c0_g1_i1.p1  ORF type:complete len:398 (-),score=79.50 TRINITY_DN113655_c0_g1_i1:145-1338(-)
MSCMCSCPSFVDKTAEIRPEVELAIQSPGLNMDDHQNTLLGRVASGALGKEEVKKEVSKYSQNSIGDVNSSQGFPREPDVAIDGEVDASQHPAQEPKELNLDSEFFRAWQMGSLIEAGRLLAEPHRSKTVRPEMREQITRVNQKYRESLKMISTQPSDLKLYGQCSGINMDWGAQLHDHGFLLVFTVNWHVKTLDELFNYVALYIDKDSTVGWDPEVVSCEALQERTPTEAVWRSQKVDGMGVKLDDVTRMSWTSALDEPENCVWIMESSLDPDQVDFEIPLPASGHARSTDILKYTTLKISHDIGNASKPFGLHVKLAMNVNPGSLTTKLMHLLPSWGLRRAIGGQLESGVRNTPAHVEANKELLQSKVKSGPTAGFYHSLRTQLLAQKAACFFLH